MTVLCSVCSASMVRSFVATLLRQHKVTYYYCSCCGFLKTEEPFWLEQAYQSAIAVTDTGLVQRNSSLSKKLAALLYYGLDSKGTFVDIAGGYGMLTRIMRDYGFDFYWSDKYCQNLFAKGFEADKASPPFKALTAFEVLEHVHDPISFITETMDSFGARTLIFTTELYRGEPPPADWWYYSFVTGQHISFFRRQTLLHIAERLSLKLYSANGVYMFTDQLINKRLFSFLTGFFGSSISSIVKFRMNSLTLADHHKLMNVEKHNS